jgi:flavin-binding protein dodecin
MSAILAADLIALATAPCHHRRNLMGHCPTCLEDAITEAIQRREDEIGQQYRDCIENAECETADARGEAEDAIRQMNDYDESLTDLRRRVRTILDDAAANSKAAIIADLERLVATFEA